MRPSLNPQTSPPIAQPRRAALLLLVICLVVFFLRLGSAPLFDLDEGLYVSCARQMVLHHDLITPALNSRTLSHPERALTPFFEKPVFVYWASAASMAAFGINEWSARLPAALCSLAAVFLVYAAGRAWAGERAGFLAGLLYATAPMTIVDARQMTTDSLLVLWFSGSMAGFWFAINGASPRRKQAGAFVFWLAGALSVLTKGVVGLLLPCLACLIYALQVESGRRAAAVRNAIAALRPLPGLALFLLVALPWHLLIWRAGGIDANGYTWVHEYLYRQHVGRFRGLDKVHNAPLPSYLVYFLFGFFPWACFSPAAFTARREAADPFRRFLLTWFGTVFLFFSASAAKLPTYIVPAYPAAALLTGRWLAEALGARTEDRARLMRTVRCCSVAALATSLLLFTAVLAAPAFIPARSPVPVEVIRLAWLLTGALMLGSLAAAALMMSARETAHRWGIGAFAAGTVALTVIGCTRGYALVSSIVSGPYQSAAAAANADAESGAAVLYYNIVPRRPSMLFYSNYSPFELRGPLYSPAAVAALSSGALDIVMPGTATAPSLAGVEMGTTLTFPGGWTLLRRRQPR